MINQKPDIMKKLFLIALVSLSALSFGQATKFSVEAAYPIPVDQNFVGDNYTGIADLGLKVRIINLRVINFGVSLNGSMLNYKDSGYFPAVDETLNFKTNLYIIQPRFFAELNLKGLTKLRPFAGVGYSLFLSKTTFDSQSNMADTTSNEGGFNTNIGLSYDIFKKVYILASYDYTILTNLEDGVPDTAYNTNVSILKVGIGIRL